MCKQETILSENILISVKFQKKAFLYCKFKLSALIEHRDHCVMSESSETIQEIAFKLMLEQNKNDKILNGTTERTIFVLGSKGVVFEL